LAKKLSGLVNKDNVIVLALPRGGVPVAFEVAAALHAPLDLMLVRKLGMPGQEELAMGALALPDICVLNQDIIQGALVSQEEIDRILAEESKELLRRNRLYRGDEPPPNLKGQIVILVDDGVATGANMRAAINAVVQQHPSRVVVAVPVASEQAIDLLKQYADDVICLQIPAVFFSVGQAYDVFSPTSDEEVLTLLKEARYTGNGPVNFPGKV
jgi:putative phosphoribosyl transferase